VTIQLQLTNISYHIYNRIIYIYIYIVSYHYIISNNCILSYHISYVPETAVPASEDIVHRKFRFSGDALFTTRYSVDAARTGPNLRGRVIPLSVLGYFS
jgi:hypothetical protein